MKKMQVVWLLVMAMSLFSTSLLTAQVLPVKFGIRGGVNLSDYGGDVNWHPEFTIGKSLSIPIIAGISADRPAFYEERSLKSFLKAMNREHDPHFTVAPYVSVGLKYRF